MVGGDYGGRSEFYDYWGKQTMVLNFQGVDDPVRSYVESVLKH